MLCLATEIGIYQEEIGIKALQNHLIKLETIKKVDIKILILKTNRLLFNK